MRLSASIVLLLINFHLSAQDSLNILFIGNSYTGSNNLPVLIENLASSNGDFAYTEQSVNGGYTFKLHSTDVGTINKINKGNWDFVVLQEQSQLPALRPSTVAADVFPYAAQLNQMVIDSNPCAETVFFMTWGRKNGDTQNCGTWPPVCTYQGMDSLLRERYTTMADTNEAIISPVGTAWRFVIDNYPWIDLYTGDGSHPNLDGSFLAACCFYAIIYKKDPTKCSFNTTLSKGRADTLRRVARDVAFYGMGDWNVGKYDPQPMFTDSLIDDTVLTVSNTSSYCDSFIWVWGDGDSSFNINPGYHIYQDSGSYDITLIGWNDCGLTGEFNSNVHIDIQDPDTSMNGLQVPQNKISIYPNPVKDILFLKSNFEGPIYIEVFNLEGKLVLEKINETKRELNIRDLKAGVYLLKISSKGQSGKSIKFFIPID